MTIRRIILAGCVLSGVAGPTVAQTCTGVEARVNARTSALVTNVTATITAATTSYVAQQTLERNQIMSGLHVFAAQSGVSLEQESSATTASAKALADTFVAQSTATQLADAAQSFGHTGYNACGVLATAQTIAQAATDAKAVSHSIHDAIMADYSGLQGPAYDAAVKNWSQTARDDTNLSIADVMSGDQTKTVAFTKLVLGPPSPPVAGGGTATGLARILQMQDEARRSAVAKVYADVAADATISDRVKALQAIWLGPDGGAKWAASLAASPDRAVLLDLNRIEAANIAAAALQLRKSLREEFALSVYALAEVDRRVSDWNAGVGGAQ